MFKYERMLLKNKSCERGVMLLCCKRRVDF